jgi:hypothetical protein
VDPRVEYESPIKVLDRAESTPSNGLVLSLEKMQAKIMQMMQAV